MTNNKERADNKKFPLTKIGRKWRSRLKDWWIKNHLLGIPYYTNHADRYFLSKVYNYKEKTKAFEDKAHRNFVGKDHDMLQIANWRMPRDNKRLRFLLRDRGSSNCVDFVTQNFRWRRIRRLTFPFYTRRGYISRYYFSSAKTFDGKFVPVTYKPFLSELVDIEVGDHTFNRIKHTINDMFEDEIVVATKPKISAEREAMGEIDEYDSEDWNAIHKITPQYDFSPEFIRDVSWEYIEYNRGNFRSIVPSPLPPKRLENFDIPGMKYYFTGIDGLEVAENLIYITPDLDVVYDDECDDFDVENVNYEDDNVDLRFNDDFRLAPIEDICPFEKLPMKIEDYRDQECLHDPFQRDVRTVQKIPIRYYIHKDVMKDRRLMKPLEFFRGLRATTNIYRLRNTEPVNELLVNPLHKDITNLNGYLYRSWYRNMYNDPYFIDNLHIRANSGIGYLYYILGYMNESIDDTMLHMLDMTERRDQKKLKDLKIQDTATAYYKALLQIYLKRNYDFYNRNRLHSIFRWGFFIPEEKDTRIAERDEKRYNLPILYKKHSTYHALLYYNSSLGPFYRRDNAHKAPEYIGNGQYLVGTEYFLYNLGNMPYLDFEAHLITTHEVFDTGGTLMVLRKLDVGYFSTLYQYIYEFRGLHPYNCFFLYLNEYSAKHPDEGIPFADDSDYKDYLAKVMDEQDKINAMFGVPSPEDIVVNRENRIVVKARIGRFKLSKLLGPQLEMHLNKLYLFYSYVLQNDHLFNEYLQVRITPIKNDLYYNNVEYKRDITPIIELFENLPIENVLRIKGENTVVPVDWFSSEELIARPFHLGEKSLLKDVRGALLLQYGEEMTYLDGIPTVKGAKFIVRTIYNQGQIFNLHVDFKKQDLRFVEIVSAITLKQPYKNSYRQGSHIKHNAIAPIYDDYWLPLLKQAEYPFMGEIYQGSAPIAYVHEVKDLLEDLVDYEYPYGNPIFVAGHKINLKYFTGWLFVEVRTSEVNRPIYPYRHASLGVIYPMGNFKTWIYSEEVLFTDIKAGRIRIIFGLAYETRPLEIENIREILSHLNYYTIDGYFEDETPSTQVYNSLYKRSNIDIPKFPTHYDYITTLAVQSTLRAIIKSFINDSSINCLQVTPYYVITDKPLDFAFDNFEEVYDYRGLGPDSFGFTTYRDLVQQDLIDGDISELRVGTGLVIKGKETRTISPFTRWLNGDIVRRIVPRTEELYLNEGPDGFTVYDNLILGESVIEGQYGSLLDKEDGCFYNRIPMNILGPLMKTRPHIIYEF